MTLLDTLVALGRRAFSEPRQAAADAMTLGVPTVALWPGFFLFVVLGVLLNFVSEAIAPTPLSTLSPVQITIFVSILMAALAYAVAKIGQIMGGQGTFENSLLLTVFFQAMFFPFQVLQVLLMIATPGLAALLQLFILGFGIWININFIAALHGFPGLGKSAGVLFLASLAVVFVMMFVSPILGVSLVGAPGNV